GWRCACLARRRPTRPWAQGRCRIVRWQPEDVGGRNKSGHGGPNVAQSSAALSYAEADTHQTTGGQPRPQTIREPANFRSGRTFRAVPLEPAAAAPPEPRAAMLTPSP